MVNKLAIDEVILNKQVSFASLETDGTCLLCGQPTEIKTNWIKTDTGEKWSTYFDLCEKCKSLESCFTCSYSRVWSLRYKAKCDVSFRLL
jgi:hypothetical protein